MATTNLSLGAIAVDLGTDTVRSLNGGLHEASVPQHVRVLNPDGRHNIAAGLRTAHEVSIEGHVGYYCAGMSQLASVRIAGNCGPGVAENMMSGEVIVAGCASQSAGASACGGLLQIEGDAAARCAISLKGADVIVRGSVGHMSAFMAQTGCLLICGDAGNALGDSLYEARIYLRGSVASLGADCVEKEMREEHRAQVLALLERAGIDELDAGEFRRFGSARRLYNFAIDNLGSY
jgi:methylamine---glutamate N-methyltransferase subunit B